MPHIFELTSSIVNVGSVSNTVTGGIDNTVSEGRSNPWKIGDIVGCIIDISCFEDEGTSTKISFTLNGANLGVAYTDIKSSVITDCPSNSLNINSDCKSKSRSKSDTKVEHTVSSTNHYYPCLSLENGEAVLLNIGQRPFSYLPREDIHTFLPLCTNLASLDSKEDRTTLHKGGKANNLQENSIPKSTTVPIAAKKGRKSKKEAAEEKSNITAAAEIKSSIPAEVNSPEHISVPYLPVLQALNAEFITLLTQQVIRSDARRVV